ncbi:hypothetical protein ASD13_03780 [Microbacterium sp. Root1433D1]|nr:hypothetical protein ASD13_03780 [Microbacterium sp. Root1433D1]
MRLAEARLIDHHIHRSENQMSDPQNHDGDTPEVEAEGIDPDMPSTGDSDDDEEDDDDEGLDVADLP